MNPKNKINQPMFHQKIFWAFTAAIFAAFAYLSLDFGITWDEWMQSHYGRLVLRYFASGGENRDFMNFAETMYLYGGLFDALSGFFYALFFDSLPRFIAGDFRDTIQGLSTEDLFGSGFYETRHVINALFGASAVLFTGLTAKILKSWRAGILAMALLVLSPRFFGHSMNNPKDIPFAAAYIFTIYFILKFLKELPRLHFKTCALTALGIGLAINSRIGGLILIFYLVLFSVIYVGLYYLKNKSGDLKITRLIFAVAGISLAGYFLGLLFWPYGQLNPLLHPLGAFGEFSNFKGAASQIFFEGRVIDNNQLPWYYIPKWVLISSPLFLIFALVFLGTFVSPKLRREFQSPWLIGALTFTLLFPLASVILTKPVLYDGWRHFLFIYPSLIILAALGWDALWESLSKPVLKIFAGLILAATMLEPFLWMVRNHPNAYVYFSPLSGGINRSAQYYETDYWGNCLREAADWLGAELKQGDPDNLFIIHSEGNLMSSYPFLKYHLGNQYISYRQVPNEYKATTKPHFGLFISKRLTKDKRLAGAWPPANTVHTVKAEDTVLCAVVFNPGP